MFLQMFTQKTGRIFRKHQKYLHKQHVNETTTKQQQIILETNYNLIRLITVCVFYQFNAIKL